MFKNPRFNLGVVLWLAAMAGVVALTLTVLPQVLTSVPHRVPVSIAIAASMLQSTVLVLLAVWAGVALSRPLGLRAPLVEAALSGTGAWPALTAQLVPGVLAGVLVGCWLVLLGRIAPAELLSLGQTIEIPLAAKLLYGGVTEEVLMRWELMTVLMATVAFYPEESRPSAVDIRCRRNRRCRGLVWGRSPTCRSSDRSSDRLRRRVRHCRKYCASPDVWLSVLAQWA